jgi:D-beta-D-heptose 7-phosphate kinase/D-beta-D-heptose 1-phosphate adenosyltransferase
LNTIDNVRKVDAVVISDYNKGFLRTSTLIKICEKFKDIPVFVDTKKEDLTMLSQCVIKINEKEFSNIKRMPPTCEFVVTLGEGGALYNDKVYETKKTEVFDVVGAGDVFLSSLVYGYLTSGSLESAIEIANKCASLSVSKMGTYVLTKEDIQNIL